MPRGYVAPRYAQRQQVQQVAVAKRDSDLATQDAAEAATAVASTSTAVGDTSALSEDIVTILQSYEARIAELEST